MQEKERLLKEIDEMLSVIDFLKSKGVDIFSTASKEGATYRAAARSILTDLSNTKIDYYIGADSVGQRESLENARKGITQDYILTNTAALWAIVTGKAKDFLEYIRPMVQG